MAILGGCHNFGIVQRGEREQHGFASVRRVVQRGEAVSLQVANFDSGVVGAGEQMIGVGVEGDAANGPAVIVGDGVREFGSVASSRRRNVPNAHFVVHDA
eukprot:8689976-Ditylum_brightwellii.AAC.1